MSRSNSPKREQRISDSHETRRAMSRSRSWSRSRSRIHCEQNETIVEEKKEVILVVKGITFNTNEYHLREIFGNYGVVRRSYIEHKVFSGGVSKLGIVVMSSEEEANLAIDYLDGSQIDGVKVYVQRKYRSAYELEQNGSQEGGKRDKNRSRHGHSHSHREDYSRERQHRGSSPSHSSHHHSHDHHRHHGHHDHHSSHHSHSSHQNNRE